MNDEEKPLTEGQSSDPQTQEETKVVLKDKGGRPKKGDNSKKEKREAATLQKVSRGISGIKQKINNKAENKRKTYKITPRQTRWVFEYLKDLNATAAAVRAGYPATTASVIGYRNKTHPVLVEYLQRENKKLLDSMEVSVEKVRAEIAKVAFSDIREVLAWRTVKTKQGRKTVSKTELSIKDSDKLSSSASASISEISQDSSGRIFVKRESKLKALETLGKHLNMFQETTVITGPNGGPVQAQIKTPTDTSKLSTAELIQLEALMKKMATGPDFVPAPSGDALGLDDTESAKKEEADAMLALEQDIISSASAKNIDISDRDESASEE